MYKPDSLALLRQRIDLAEVLSPHISLHRAGSSFKGLCPFHEEKSPSFIVQKGDTHYHCFGCGAHGDAIAFLMNYLKMNFVDAVESLAERFQVPLEREERQELTKGPSKTRLKEALEKACRLYHYLLLHSAEGRPALHYLYKRGITLDFIRLFEVGYAPVERDLFYQAMRQQEIDDEILEVAGLVLTTQTGRRRDFFSERITFPIRDAMGSCIGFSARKFKEETFGGKYINTSETPLFKKSHVLFGLSYCRRRIAKERKVIVVEGQIDALRLIHAGFDYTVAGLGTAFGEGHVRELIHLGVNHVYLALDADEAGKEATLKIGDLFQKKGVEVSVVLLEEGSDPDSTLKDHGADAFKELLEKTQDYLTFLVITLSKRFKMESPAGKNECVRLIAERIQQWEEPLMVHESLRKVAQMLQIPEETLKISGNGPQAQIKRSEKAGSSFVNASKILETDLLRWIFLFGETMPRLVDIVKSNLHPDHFHEPDCQKLFTLYLEASEAQKPRDLLSFMMQMQAHEEQAFFTEMMQKKVNAQKAEEGLIETVQRILQRGWMDEREAIKRKIHAGGFSDEEMMALAKQFDEIKKNPPKVIL